jgi:hypothetical protein
MTVLALISIGFSQLMNREARQALDRQLSLEAFYAAESGVNDAVNYLSTPGATSWSDCKIPISAQPYFVDAGDISGDKLSQYTCVSVNNTPKEIDYNLAQGETISVKVDLPTLEKLHFGWENQTYQNGAQVMHSSSGAVPLGTLLREDEVATDSTGILRVSIYPVTAGAASAPDTNLALESASRTYFLYPNGGGAGTEGSVSYASDGIYVSGHCSTTYPTLPYAQATQRFCNSAVSGLSGKGTTYYVKLTALYAPLGVSIEGSDSSGNALGIPNTEGVIDVTGSGNDIIKRVQALRPIGNYYDYPNEGLRSMQAVCKLFRVDMVGQGQYGDTRPESGVPNDDGMCATPFNANSPTEGGGLGSIGDIPCPAGYVGNYPDCQPPPPPPPPPPPANCGDYSLSVGMGSASVGGNNPCGEGIAQCNAFNSGGGSIAQIFTHGGSYPTSVSYSPPAGTAYVGCWSTDGRFGTS